MCRRLEKQLVSFVLVLSLFANTVSTAEAGSGGGQIVFDPQNFARAGEILAQTLDTVTKLEHLLSIAQDNFKKFQDFNSDDILPLLTKLKSAVETGQAVAYTMENVDALFKEKYPGYKPFENYPDLLNQWSTTALDTLRGNLDAVHLQANDLTDEEAFIHSLEVLGATSGGQNQMLMTANMIAIEMVKQMKKLRQLSMSQINSQNVYLANQVNAQAQLRATEGDWLKKGEDPVPTYEENASRGIRANDIPIPPRRSF